jgi:asparagine synthase (glutamine-hydrolysing)
MFSFALYDRNGGAGRLFLARDRLGIKPLYYFYHPDYVVFASEVRALLSSGLVPRRLDFLALDQYLSYLSIPAARTLIEGVRCVPPGSVITVGGSDGRMSTTKYWDAAADAEMGHADRSHPTVAADRLRKLLLEAVDLHLVSDVPVATFLSGGVDSGGIAALMRESGHRAHTFTVGFSGHPDETESARATAAFLGTDHEEVRLRDDDVLSQVTQALDAMDQPSGDAINTYVVCGAVRAAGIKVAVSGLGGDELFGGYPSFRRFSQLAPLLTIWRHTPRTLRRTAATCVSTVFRTGRAGRTAGSLMHGNGTIAESYPATRQVFSPLERRALLTPFCKDQIPDAPDPYVVLLRENLTDARHGPFTQLSYAEARTYMQDVLLRDTDQMSMAHGLEVRVPFLDHHVVSYVMGLPDQVKASNGVPKGLLVKALGSLLPPETVSRPKQGFVLPFDDWMRGPLRGFCEDRLGPRGLGGRGLFDTSRLTALWERFQGRHSSVSWARIWMLVALSEWLESTGV